MESVINQLKNEILDGLNPTIHFEPLEGQKINVGERFKVWWEFKNTHDAYIYIDNITVRENRYSRFNLSERGSWRFYNDNTIALLASAGLYLEPGETGSTENSPLHMIATDDSDTVDLPSFEERLPEFSRDIPNRVNLNVEYELLYSFHDMFSRMRKYHTIPINPPVIEDS